MNEETMTPEAAEEKKGLNFVEQIVSDDLAAGKNGGRLNTRFPPEPNATSISDTPRPYVWTSVWPKNSAAHATCASTTPTRQGRCGICGLHT